MSNRLWLATPTRRSPRARGVERAVEHALVAARRPRPWSAYGACGQPDELGFDLLHREVRALHDPHADRRAARAPDAPRPTRTARRAPRASRGGTPAARCPPAASRNSGSSSTVRKAASVRWRSRYSSMSRYTSFGGVARPPTRYTCRSRSTIRATEWSNASTSRFAHSALILTDTQCTSARCRRRRDRVEPGVGLVVAEDRLAEQVDVAVDPRDAPPRRDDAANAGSRRGQDHATRLGLDARPHDPRDERPARPRTLDRREPQPGAVDRPERAGEAGRDEATAAGAWRGGRRRRAAPRRSA